MSELHTSLVQQEMEENGEMDFIRSHVAAANAAAAGNQPPAEGSDTAQVEATEEVTEVQPEATPPENVVEENAAEADALTPEEEETLYLELDDVTQALIDSKYGGDINKALAALPQAQSKIGQQGNEMGALRKQLEEMEARITQGLAAAQPYPEFPDEFEDTSVAAARLHEIAEAAFDRRDPQTFDRAITAWAEADPVSAGLYRNLKEMQVAQIVSAQEAPEAYAPEATLEAAVGDVISKFPQFQDEGFQQMVAAELDKTPSLKAVLWGQVPGVSVEERATILAEAAERVVARTTSETVQQARRRIAVRTAEEARAARVETQVSRGTTARDEGVEPEARTLPMGDTGRSLNIDRLNAMLDPEDRV